jgi:hypothetical protein
VLTALIRTWNREGRATVRSVAENAGLPVSTTADNLRELRDLHLVTWNLRIPGRTSGAGTLRPLLWPVNLPVSGRT